MYEAPLANENLNVKIENLKIFQNNNQYLLNMNISREQLALTLSEIGKINSNSFSKTVRLNELKQIHKSFSLISSCFDFSEYLKKLCQNNQLFVNKKENEIILGFTSEYLLNVEIIEIILLPDRINVEKKLKEACNEIEFLKQKIKNLENKNDELKKENVQMINLIYEIINENKKLKENNNYMEDQIFNIKNDIAFLKKNNDNNKKINSPISLMKYKY
jgi:hypothetical protein